MTSNGVAVIALVGLLAQGCASRNGVSSPEPIMPPTPTFERRVLGQSVKGREVVMYVFRGDGPTVLLIGGIHGNEQTSVDVARGLLDLLREQPELARGRTVAIIANTNPDGYAANSRFNANRIDLNRNFPARNFKPQLGPTTRAAGGGRGGGSSPLSEPESCIIYDVIEQLQPRLLISIHSIDRGRECNNFDGPAEAIARIMSQHNGYRVTDSIGYPTPGSLGSYAGIDKQVPMITLELPRSVDGARAWEQNREALLWAIATAGDAKSETRISKTETNPNDQKKK